MPTPPGITADDDRDAMVLMLPMHVIPEVLVLLDKYPTPSTETAHDLIVADMHQALRSAYIARITEDAQELWAEQPQPEDTAESQVAWENFRAGVLAARGVKFGV